MKIEKEGEGHPEWFFLTSGRKNCIEGWGEEDNYSPDLPTAFLIGMNQPYQLNNKKNRAQPWRNSEIKTGETGIGTFFHPSRRFSTTCS